MGVGTAGVGVVAVGRRDLETAAVVVGRVGVGVVVVVVAGCCR